MDYRIYPPDGFVDATVDLPLSKSMSNRALIINALTAGAEPLENVAVCDDTEAMIHALGSSEEVINIGAAGTAMRFLTAYFATREGRTVTLDGSERMRQRPISQLVDGLRALGARIEYVNEVGFPPLKIEGCALDGGEVTVSQSASSQYLSALMMIAPAMANGLTINIEGEIPSLPYVKMTLEMMERAGIDGVIEPNRIKINPGVYRLGGDWRIEKDWSAASYWYEVTALSSGCVALPGLALPSLQGDRGCRGIFEKIGVVTEKNEDGEWSLSPSPDLYSRLEIDMSDTPDLAQTVAVTAAVLGVPFRLSGLASLIIKETDRLEALRAELDKLGIVVEVENNSILSWNGERHPVWELPVIETYNDHRMAMAFAPVAVFCPGMIVKDVEVVSKSYPEFWSHLEAAGFVLQNAEDEPLGMEVEEE